MYYRVNDQVVENYDAGSNINKSSSDGLPMWLLILIIVFVLILLAGGVYYFMHHNTN